MTNRLLLTCILALAALSTAFVVQPATRGVGADTCISSTSHRTTSTALFAKKKKKKANKKEKKGGFEWASSFVLQPYEAQAVRDLASIAVACFKARAGNHLLPELESTPDVPKTLWNAPNTACVIVQQDDADAGVIGTKVMYANVAALETVGLQPIDFQQLFSTGAPPSSQKDETDDDGDDDEKEEVNKSVAATTTMQLNLPPTMKGDKKFERGYSKKVLKQNNSDDDDSNNDITIMNAYRWDVEKSIILNGKFVTSPIGVAYAWSEWMIGDSLLCQPGGIQDVVGDLEDLEAIEDKIAQQGAVIRDLKENQGLKNKDPLVVAAVAELLRLKDLKGDK